MPNPSPFLYYLPEKSFSHVYGMFIRNCLLKANAFGTLENQTLATFCFKQRVSILFVILAPVALRMLVIISINYHSNV